MTISKKSRSRALSAEQREQAMLQAAKLYYDLDLTMAMFPKRLGLDSVGKSDAFGRRHVKSAWCASRSCPPRSDAPISRAGCSAPTACARQSSCRIVARTTGSSSIASLGPPDSSSPASIPGRR